MGPGGRPRGLQEPGPGCLGNLQAEKPRTKDSGQGQRSASRGSLSLPTPSALQT